jgi:hypothetical protein
MARQRRSQETQALAYARAGWPVFPLLPGSKEPATAHGFKDAVTDPGQIRHWWRRNPDRNVGIATGFPGPDVVDVDQHGDAGSGFAAWNQLRRGGLLTEPYAVISTPSGGMHCYYPGTDQPNGSIRRHHVDFRGHGGYVVAPPSVTPAGGYELVKHDAEAVAEPVDWAAVRQNLDPPKPRAVWAPEPGMPPDEHMDRILDWYATSNGPGDRNFPLFLAAKYAERAGILHGGNVERLVGALGQADPSCNREAEARRTIESGRRSAQREGGAQPPSHDGHTRPFEGGEREAGS